MAIKLIWAIGTITCATASSLHGEEVAMIAADDACREDNSGKCEVALVQLRATKAASEVDSGYECRHCLPDQCVQVGHPECLSGQVNAPWSESGAGNYHSSPDNSPSSGYYPAFKPPSGGYYPDGYDNSPSGGYYPLHDDPASGGYYPTSPSSTKGNCLMGAACSQLDSSVAPVVCGSTTCCCTGSVAPQLNGDMCTCLR